MQQSEKRIHNMERYHQYVLLFLVTIIAVCKGQTTHNTKVSNNKLVVCYVGSWAVYRPERGSFAIENIVPELCTHIIYSFAGLNATADMMRSLDPWQDLSDNYGKNGYGRMVQIKQQHPKVKISLALGGWNEGSANYSALASSRSRRMKFVLNAIQFIRKYNFDGLDLDWEFPGKRGGVPEDKKNFVLLVKELHVALSKQNLLLTAALHAAPDTIDIAYDVPALSQYLDFIHLMCYDYHGTWDAKTGSNAPLHSAPNDTLSVEYSINYMLKLGAPKEKLVIGVPFYGRTFVLTEVKEGIQKLGAGAVSGFQGPYTRETGFMGYNEICIELQNNAGEWEIHWDELSKTPFAVNENKVISYDNPQSITDKVRLVQKYKLAGVMIWSIDTDDFHGDCENSGGLTIAKGFPLLRTINIVLAQPYKESDDIDTNEIPKETDKKDEPSSGTISKTSFGLLIMNLLLLNLY